MISSAVPNIVQNVRAASYAGLVILYGIALLGTTVAAQSSQSLTLKKVQEGCKIRRTYRIFGYTRRDKLFIAFEADRFNHSRTSPRGKQLLAGGRWLVANPPMEAV